MYSTSHVRLGLALLLGVACWVSSIPAPAQPYPTKPITIIVPYGVGTGNDVIARALGEKISSPLGRPVVAENRPGASGGLGAELAARARPDGYTLFIGSTTSIVNQHAAKVRYNITKDFAPVALVGGLPTMYLVPAAFPATTMAEFVAQAKSRPGAINYAAPPGSVLHLLGEMFKTDAAIDVVLIPYKSTTDATADVITGRVGLWITTPATALPQIKAGRARALATAGVKRSDVLPDVPTLAEAGFPNINISLTYFILAPTGTPKPIVDRLNAEMMKALETKDVNDRLQSQGVIPMGSSPEALGAHLEQEDLRWGRVVRQAKFRVD